MLNFTTSTSQDFAEFGRRLWLERSRFSSHEQAAQYITEELYHAFVTKTGDVQLALVRVFCSVAVDELPTEVRALVDDSEEQVMALTGTWGMEEAWQDRNRSQGHQAVPISGIAVPEQIPMFQEVLTQMGIDLEHFYATKELVVKSGSPYQGKFYIPDARSDAIPAQDGFVRPYGIQSLVGFGGFIGSQHRLYLVYAFSRIFISPEMAQNFHTLHEFIATTIAIEDRIFDE